jgi:hypothetical protein
MVSTVGSTTSHNKHLSFSGCHKRRHEAADSTNSSLDVLLWLNGNMSPLRSLRLFTLVSSPRPVRRPGLQHGRKNTDARA